MLGTKIAAWANRQLKASDLFQAHDVVNALSLVFTLDDSKFWIDTVGPKGAAMTVAGEVYVKMVAGILHIVAVETA